MSAMNLTKKIPIALNSILKEEQQYTRKLFNDSLPQLLNSYGNLCVDSGDKRVYAEIPIGMKQSRAFWTAMSHHHSRRPEERAADSCFFWLGFCPTRTEEKRLIIDEAAQLLTHQTLESDIERDEWLDEYGSMVFPGYNHYSEVMKMKWNPV
jgi:hypothetical protein